MKSNPEYRNAAKRRMIMGQRVGVAMLALSAIAATPAWSQNYPIRSVRIVTGGAGGANDFVTRLIAQGLSASFGQPVVVDNKASGVLEGETVARAAPDGYTLLVSSGNLWISGFMQQVPYDPLKDFKTVTLATTAPYILVVTAQLPAKSVAELVALAKAQPGKLNYVTLANGSSNHLAGELFKALTSVEMTRVSYKAAATGLTDLATGQVHMMFSAVQPAMPHVKSGKIRALAVTSDKPSALFPDLPTVGATVKGFESAAPLGVLAPAGTPDAIVTRLNRVIVEYLKTKEVHDRLFSAAIEAVASTPAEFTAMMKIDMARWEKIIKAAGIRVD